MFLVSVAQKLSSDTTIDMIQGYLKIVFFSNGHPPSSKNFPKRSLEWLIELTVWIQFLENLALGSHRQFSLLIYPKKYPKIVDLPIIKWSPTEFPEFSDKFQLTVGKGGLEDSIPVIISLAAQKGQFSLSINSSKMLKLTKLNTLNY